ncbi:MAG: VTT domain-containing protein [Faecalibacterium sp.]
MQAPWFAPFLQLLELSFWENLLAQFQYLGAGAPILLAAIESLIPALPLVGIVLLNVTAHGFFWGLAYSWVGASVGSTIVFFFFRKVVRPYFDRFVVKFPTLQKAQDWVAGFNPAALFFLAIMPFTPSSFLNVAFGISEVSPRKYLCTIYAAKMIMISLLALFGQSFVTAFTQPWVIVLSLGLLAGLYGISKKLNKKYNL